ncbi:hypothetical protein PVK06_048646 [Gossypium arboreum]|uniref:RIN4 pathogenic type III effector avirulence factor Avr cleavage site domain-containing protein n=1 Tax=Gossypium arboreum TaxID=29729 RepID=A0ABR0MGT4_GOSAR|nr:hypothetical protein PVK06_048646 [Gossypium arboreum]
MSEKGRPLPKFGEWDVNDPASAEGFTVIFNKARDEKKTGGKPESPSGGDPHVKPGADPSKTQPTVSILDFYADMMVCFPRKNGFAACTPRLRNLEVILPV